jgi:hypothetical protein
VARGWSIGVWGNMASMGGVLVFLRADLVLGSILLRW